MKKSKFKIVVILTSMSLYANKSRMISRCPFSIAKCKAVLSIKKYNFIKKKNFKITLEKKIMWKLY